MHGNRERGSTLVELLMALAIMGIVSVAAAGLLSSSLQAYGEGRGRFDLQREGLLAMERMTGAVRVSTYLLVPNSHGRIRDVLAVSGLVNDDGDCYFGDPLFPMIDEDLASDMNEDGRNGVEDVDDDGDGSTDETGATLHGADDDEDGVSDEDPLNGIDDDGDGAVDEDLGGDSTDDGAPGHAGIDDDGDGEVDEGSVYDDDEDGTLGEQGLHPVVFELDPSTRTLVEWDTVTGERVVLASNVEDFEVTFRRPQVISIELSLRSGDDELTFFEYVCARNVQQRVGKRVR